MTQGSPGGRGSGPQAGGPDAVGGAAGAGAVPRRGLARLTRAKWFKPFRNAGVLLVGRGASGVLELAVTAIAARALMVSDFGALLILHGFVALVAGLLRGNCMPMIVRYGTGALEAGDSARLFRVLRLGVLVEGAAAVLVVAATIPATMLLAPMLFELPPSLVALAGAYAAAAAALLAFGSVANGLLMLHGRFDLLSAQTVAKPMLRLAACAVAWAAGLGLPGFAAAWLLGVAAERVTLVAMGAWEASRHGQLRELLRFRDGIAAEETGIWEFLLHTKLEKALDLARLRGDTLLVGALVGPAGAALYRVARQVTGLFRKSARNILGQAIQPEVARLHAQRRVRLLYKTVLRSSALASALAVLVLGLLAAFGEALLTAVAGPGFAEAYAVLLLLAAAGTLELAIFPLGPWLVATGRGRALALSRGLAVAGYFAAMAVLCQSLGLVGAGLAAIGYTLLFAGAVGAWLGLARRARG